MEKEKIVEEILKTINEIQEANKRDRELNTAILNHFQMLVVSLASLVEVLFERDPELQKSYQSKYQGKFQALAAQGNPVALDVLTDIVQKFGGGKPN